jgi:predicted O-methyltransferase YrrM
MGSNASRPLPDRLSRLEAGAGLRAFAHRAYLALHRGAERVGLHVVRASYDSPIPRKSELPPETFERQSAMRAIEWSPELQMRFVETELSDYLAEFQPSSGPTEVGSFRLGNGTYDSVDAELLFAMVRWSAPARYVELGSGYSTLIAALALQRNGKGVLRCYDPYPSPHVLARPELAAHLQAVSVQALSEAVVRELQAGDILFVDTSHTVKMGGDVNRIVFEMLPLVAPGVLVHFHDVFWPYDYSRGHVGNAHYWTEQYLLQAFLMYNADWEVVVGGQAIARHAPDRLRVLVPSFHDGVSPGALWLRRRV